jgi:hypothetical protein
MPAGAGTLALAQAPSALDRVCDMSNHSHFSGLPNALARSTTSLAAFDVPFYPKKNAVAALTKLKEDASRCLPPARLATNVMYVDFASIVFVVGR